MFERSKRSQKVEISGLDNDMQIDPDKMQLGRGYDNPIKIRDLLMIGIAFMNNGCRDNW